MLDCHSIVGLYTYQNRVPCAPSLRWVSCEEREKLLHQGANFHSSVVHYPKTKESEEVSQMDLQVEVFLHFPLRVLRMPQAPAPDKSFLTPRRKGLHLHQMQSSIDLCED